jgi:predicted AAA+ superfamily ATPase
MIENQCVSQLTESSKIVLIYGPRQAGKTTLAKQIAQKSDLKALYVNADLLKYETMFVQRDIATIQSLTEGYELLIIDEAQRIADIGLVLKIIHDEMPNIKVIATGSSSFDLANKVSEPLTGRKKIFHLLPFSLAEIKQDRNAFEISEMLDEMLVYGMYPEVFTTKNIKNKTSVLSEICESYLFKDILILGNIKYTSKIKDLLRLLAFQIGQQVSINELTQKLSINRETVERYIEILEKAFVIFRLPAYQRNMRKEVSKMDKIYFYDTGLRNCLIDNLKTISMRDDTGHLWENFIVAERRKQLLYQDKKANCYFWRTYTGAEIDYIEETGDGLFGYEIKLGKEKIKAPKAWIEEYNGGFDLINRSNYVNWLLKEL